MRHVPPAGAPISLGDLGRWGAAAARGDAVDRLRETFRTRFGVRHSFVTSTGRAGLTLLLRALHSLASGRDEVVIPSYTCYSVAASIVKAGLRPRIVDISPETLDYPSEDLKNADFGRVLAIIATNLYGIPNDLSTIADVARTNGAFLIDDAAQAMGAAVSGRLSGTWGDAGLFSFDKGKNVSAIDGGVIVTNSDDIAVAMRAQMTALAKSGMRETCSGIAKAGAYVLLLRPRLYWIPNRIPQLNLGKTVFTTDFPLRGANPALAALAAVMMGRLDEFTRSRRANAALLAAELERVGGAQTVGVLPHASPVYLRFPILLPNDAVRRRAIDALHAAGLGGSPSYPASIADIPDLVGKLAGSRGQGGRQVAERILTLPTHPLVERGDIIRMVQIIAQTIEDAPRHRKFVCAV